MPDKIEVTIERQRGVPFPNFDALRRQFLIELGRLVNAVIIPELRRASRRRSGELRGSWRVAVSPTDGLPTGIKAIWYWTVQPNKREFHDIVARHLPRLVREAARRAARRI